MKTKREIYAETQSKLCDLCLEYIRAEQRHEDTTELLAKINIAEQITERLWKIIQTEESEVSGSVLVEIYAMKGRAQ